MQKSKKQDWFPTCQICKKTQQQLLADILTDQSKCKLTICTICLNHKNYQNLSCSTCGNKYKDHKKKLKNVQFVKNCLEKGKQQYQKLHSIRTECKKLANVDQFQEMYSLLITLYKFDKQKFKARQKQLKKADQQIEKSKNYVIGQVRDPNEWKLPKLLSTQYKGDGKAATGWSDKFDNYSKGIQLIFNAFSNKNIREIEKVKQRSNNKERNNNKSKQMINRQQNKKSDKQAQQIKNKQAQQTKKDNVNKKDQSNEDQFQIPLTFGFTA